MNGIQKRFFASVFFATVAAFATQSLSATFPDHPIRIIVPTTAGSIPDQVARWLGERLTSELGQPVVIENRPGAGGAIGLDAVAKAAPDGYTLGVQTLPFVIAPLLNTQTPYDTERDLATVTLVNWSFNVLVVPATSSARSVAELVALAKTKSGGLTYSSPGTGTPPHLVLTLFAQSTGISLLHAPYKGGPASLTAVLSGDVDLTTAGTAQIEQPLKVGRLRALAATSPRRIPAFPNLPTLVEQGYAGVELSDWQGIVTAAGTPRLIIDRLHAAITRVMGRPETRQSLAAMGMEPAGLGPDQFAAYQRAEIDKWRAVAKAARMTAD